MVYQASTILNTTLNYCVRTTLGQIYNFNQIFPSKKFVMFNPAKEERSQFQPDNRFFFRLFEPRFTLLQAFMPDTPQQQLHQFIKNQEQPEKYIKGLKELSKKVKEVAFGPQPLTYRDVANKLILDSAPYLNTLQTSEKQKQQQNIKRRVYDALNVLIASKILIKKGKKVRGNQHQSNSQKSSLQSQIDKKNKSIKQKKRHYEELQAIQIKLKQLLQRNRQAWIPNKKVMLPIVALLVDRKKTVESLRNSHIFTIKSKQNILVLREEEILSRFLII